jgi:hypothetical protein
MIKKSMREIIFFVLIFLLFFLTVKLGEYWVKKSDIDHQIAYIILGIAYTALVVGIFFLSKLEDNSNEKFWDITPAAYCKGGPYFWQGDSEVSKMCRKLASTPEGRVLISGYNCPSGYVGQPGLPFNYTPLSDDNWENERCEDRKECEGVDVGLCSLEKQVP